MFYFKMSTSWPPRSSRPKMKLVRRFWFLWGRPPWPPRSPTSTRQLFWGFPLCGWPLQPLRSPRPIMELVLIWILITSTTTEVIEALNQTCLEVLLFNGDLHSLWGQRGWLGKWSLFKEFYLHNLWDPAKISWVDFQLLWQKAETCKTTFEWVYSFSFC